MLSFTMKGEFGYLDEYLTDTCTVELPVSNPSAPAPVFNLDKDL